jgi:hypothetical protein
MIDFLMKKIEIEKIETEIKIVKIPKSTCNLQVQNEELFLFVNEILQLLFRRY